MANVTRATQALVQAKIMFSVVRYVYDSTAERIGLHAASALGVDPHMVIKTLMARVDGKPVCILLSSAAEASMKMLATALDGKRAEMMRPADAERLTGYWIGGISPFGQPRKVPVVIDRHVLDHEHIYVNAGQRGLQLCLATKDAAHVLGALVAPIALIGKAEF